MSLRHTPPTAAILSGCPQIYIDIGLNVGDNLRALYEPSTSRKLNRTFGSVYGGADARASVCAVGIEPNPIHAERLAALERRLRGLRHRAHIFGFAVSNVSDGTATYWTDTSKHNMARHGWGSSLLRWAANMDEGHAVQVRSHALSQVLRSLFWSADGGSMVASSRPAGGVVGIKIDCEGCEYDAIPAATAELCASVDVLWLERHDRFFSRSWRGHKAGFSSEGRVEALDASLREMRSRRAAGRCRTDVRKLSTME